LGLGSIALRSLPFYQKEVNRILRHKPFDLIYFSTTQFPVCILGNYWKKKFNTPYVIDMQDPWHTDYYQDKPKQERPAKHWFSYRLNKILEPIAIKGLSGLIAVSDAYITTLKQRYPSIKNKPSATITFGAFQDDFKILGTKEKEIFPAIQKRPGEYSLVYIGRGGHDMKDALSLLFKAFKRGLQQMPQVFKHFHFHFIGTSYAPAGKGEKTIAPIAAIYGLQAHVSEQTERVPFYQGLATLKIADGFIIPGSNDPAYTASKLYPYILAQKPLLGIFHEVSSATTILKECKAGKVVTLQTDIEIIYKVVEEFLENIYRGRSTVETDWSAFAPYTAKEMCRQQVTLFEKVLSAAN
jgi:hypothetical protein